MKNQEFNPAKSEKFIECNKNNQESNCDLNSLIELMENDIKNNDQNHKSAKIEENKKPDKRYVGNGEKSSFFELAPEKRGPIIVPKKTKCRKCQKVFFVE